MKKCLACRSLFQSRSWCCPQCGHAPTERKGFPLFAPSLSTASSTYDSDRHVLVAEAEESHFWFRTRAALILWAFGRFFSHAQSYLELGCGTGFVLSCLKTAFPQLQVVGSDLLLSGLERAQERLPALELLQMDVRNLPFEKEFSVIGAYDVIEHIEEDEAVLSQFYQALDHGGGLILTVPQHPSLWSHHDERARHVRRYLAADLKTKVERAGFQVKRMTSFYLSTLPLMWASRRSPRQATQDGSHEFRPPAIINEALHRLLGVERSLIRWGVNLPTGSSILLVAEKV